MYYGLLLTWESPTMKKNQPSLGDVHVKAMRNLRPRNHGYREAILLMCLPEQGDCSRSEKSAGRVHLRPMREGIFSNLPLGRKRHGKETVLLSRLPQQGARTDNPRKERQFDLSQLRQGVLSAPISEGKVLFKTLHRCLPQGTWPIGQKSDQQDLQKLREGVYHPDLLVQEVGTKGWVILFQEVLP